MINFAEAKNVGAVHTHTPDCWTIKISKLNIVTK